MADFPSSSFSGRGVSISSSRSNGHSSKMRVYFPPVSQRTHPPIKRPQAQIFRVESARTRPRPHPLAGSGLVVASRQPSNQKAPTQRKRVALWGRGPRLPLYLGNGCGLALVSEGRGRGFPNTRAKSCGLSPV